MWGEPASLAGFDGAALVLVDIFTSPPTRPQKWFQLFLVRDFSCLKEFITLEASQCVTNPLKSSLDKLSSSEYGK